MTMLEKESIEIETKIATEALRNIRTIVSLSKKNWIFFEFINWYLQ